MNTTGAPTPRLVAPLRAVIDIAVSDQSGYDLRCPADHRWSVHSDEKLTPLTPVTERS